MNVCKSSLLELETMEHHKNVFECEINNNTKTVTPESVDIHFPDFSFATNASDKVSELELFAQAEDYSFELNVHARKSKVLLNGGNGAVAWGPGYKQSTHWSIPAAQTSGTLDIGEGGEPLTLVPSESLTWYDHQNIEGAPSNFTWFTVHFPTTEIQVSIWAYEWPESGDIWRYATVRLGEETTMVLPFTLEADWSDVWVSPESNTTFPQSWSLKFDNGDFLNLRAAKAEQEIQPRTWTGFIVAEESNFFGQTSGFGLGDVVHLL